MDCIFCQIVAGELPSSKIYEDDELLAFLDIHPVNTGHILLIPKTHSENLLDTPDEVLAKMSAVSKILARAAVAATKAGGFNLSTNNGRAAGQDVLHLHFHIIPRHSHDGHKAWSHRDYQEGERERVAEEIKKHLK